MSILEQIFFSWCSPDPVVTVQQNLTIEVSRDRPSAMHRGGADSLHDA